MITRNWVGTVGTGGDRLCINFSLVGGNSGGFCWDSYILYRRLLGPLNIGDEILIKERDFSFGGYEAFWLKDHKHNHTMVTSIDPKKLLVYTGVDGFEEISKEQELRDLLTVPDTCGFGGALRGLLTGV